MRYTMQSIIAYIRVSTKQQGESGLGLEAQRASVARYCELHRCKVLAEYVEVETGKSANRPQLAAAIAESRRTGATLVVAKLDRLARNVAFTSVLMESGVQFVACDMPDANHLTIHIMAAMAEDEARRISQRTKDALAAAKARGQKLGSAREGHWDQIKDKCGWANMDPERKRSLKAAKLQESFGPALPLILTLSERGETSGRIAEELNRHGYQTPRGCQFRASTVRRVLEQHALVAA